MFYRFDVSIYTFMNENNTSLSTILKKKYHFAYKKVMINRTYDFGLELLFSRPTSYFQMFYINYICVKSRSSEYSTFKR